ncbi:tRNA 2-thiocytidine(32) synthetase TtcA [candidate division KSB1 bacterium]|nr:tRNA 2-thiocytidine(32) synthetase TtcA [candidate division KSB1 bacterium]
MTRLHRKIRTLTEKAILDYGMINPGDRVLIGISGGADSMSLLKILQDGLVQFKHPFTLIAAHIDLGFDESSPRNSERLAEYFKELGIDYEIEHTQISKLAFDPDTRKNPCFICSHHRRKNIYEIAHRNRCTTIAYGHHKDDIIETLLMNILYGRTIGSMNPVQEVFEGSKHIIRPFAYVDEGLLKSFSRESGFPSLTKLCPAEGNTSRQQIKDLIRQLQKNEKHANIRENIFKSHYCVNIDFKPKQSRQEKIKLDFIRQYLLSWLKGKKEINR